MIRKRNIFKFRIKIVNKEVEQIIQNHTQYQDTLTEDTLLDILEISLYMIQLEDC